MAGGRSDRIGKHVSDATASGDVEIRRLIAAGKGPERREVGRRRAGAHHIVVVIPQKRSGVLERVLPLVGVGDCADQDPDGEHDDDKSTAEKPTVPEPEQA
jgi:hypothetical protein